eukprot:scaffold36903_cov66-Phaeocystis_antarctica.AAC.2
MRGLSSRALKYEILSSRCRTSSGGSECAPLLRASHPHPHAHPAIFIANVSGAFVAASARQRAAASAFD